MSGPWQPNNLTEAAQLARVAARDFEGFKRALLGNVQLYADIQAGRTCMGSPVLAENVLAEIANEVDLLVRAVAPAGAPMLGDDPFGDGLIDVLSRAAQMLWGTQADRPADRPTREAVIEMGRICSGRATRIQTAFAQFPDCTTTRTVEDLARFLLALPSSPSLPTEEDKLEACQVAENILEFLGAAAPRDARPA